LHNIQNKTKKLIQTRSVRRQHIGNCRLFSRIIDDKQMSIAVYSTTVPTSSSPAQTASNHFVTTADERGTISEARRTRCTLKNI